MAWISHFLFVLTVKNRDLTECSVVDYNEGTVVDCG